MVDSTFEIANAPYLIKLSQCDPLDIDALRLNQEATSICQLSKWGIHMIHASFPGVISAPIESQIERNSARFDLRLKQHYGAYVEFKHHYTSNHLVFAHPKRDFVNHFKSLSWLKLCSVS